MKALVIFALVLGLLGYPVLYHLGGAGLVIALGAGAALGAFELGHRMATGRWL